MAILGKSKTDEELINIGFKDSDNINILPLPRITLASVESLTIPLLQEVVILADFRCKGCQERVADIMSRMNGETESVVVSVMEKKVTLTFRYSSAVEVPTRQVSRIYQNSVSKLTLFMRLFRPSCS